MIRSVLFVCAGNICRSPIAEAAFRQIAESRPALGGLEIGSAGTVAMHGNSAAPEAIEAARDELGADLTRHRARNVDRIDADLILTLDHTVTRDVKAMNKKGRVELLGEYAGTGEPVGDPYGCSRQDFDTCARHIRTLVEATAKRLEEELTSSTQGS